MLSRRTLIQAAAALFVPSAALSAPLAPRRKPPRLRRGDTVGLVEPAYFTADAFDLDQVMATIRAMGLVPRPAPHLLNRYGYLAGRDRSARRQLNAMFADPGVRAIFAVRGGWGCARVLPHLDFNLIRANPEAPRSASATSPRSTSRSRPAPTARAFTVPLPPDAWGRLSWEVVPPSRVRRRNADLASP